jgi:hypothetical protein
MNLGLHRNSSTAGQFKIHVMHTPLSGTGNIISVAAKADHGQRVLP